MFLLMLLFIFFFFKQKTAYEMRISDWSSDVCSSDLTVGYDFGGFRAEVEVGFREADIKSGRFTSPGVPSNANGAGSFTGNTDLNGDSNALSFMVNGLLDFGDRKSVV